jgi:type IV secretion system protein VirB5
MKRRLFAAAGAALFVAISGTADAQIIVHDPTSYAKILQEAQTALNQLKQLEQQVAQGRQLLTSLNQISNVNALATSLSQPALRAFLPDANAFVTAATTAQGDLAALGAIGAKAQQIRQANILFTARSGDAAGADLMAAGNRAALNLATAESVGEAGASRLTGLQQLQSALDTAPNARAVLDLQARLLAEQAMIANDQMRLQGLAMTQAAQDQLQTQRERERAAAASQARLQLYQSVIR